MTEFGSHKLSRSRSQRLKGESDSTILHLTRKKPISVPKSITFIRGTAPRTRQAFLDANQWVSLDETLGQLISQESTMINDYHAQHPVPPPLETSAEAFISDFERSTVRLGDREQTESIRSFCKSFGSIFSAHVTLLLLYESEMHSADVIKQNPLRNSPAMYLLRFLYAFPSLMKSESTETASAKIMQKHLKELIKFATKNSKLYFVLPNVHTSGKSGGREQRVVIKLSKD